MADNSPRSLADELNPLTAAKTLLSAAPELSRTELITLRAPSSFPTREPRSDSAHERGLSTPSLILASLAAAAEQGEFSHSKISQREREMSDVSTNAQGGREARGKMTPRR